MSVGNRELRPDRAELGPARTLGAALLAAVLFLSFLGGDAEARPGAPDRSFGKGSLAEVGFAPSYSPATFSSVEALPEGAVRLWEAGTDLEAGYRHYQPGGELVAEPGGPETQPLRAATPDGGTVELEGSFATHQEVIRKKLPDGSPDPSFGEGGQERLPFFSEGEWSPLSANATNLVPLASGGILVGGSSVYREVVGARGTLRETEIALVRLAPDGKLDPGFGGDGVVKLRTDLGIGVNPELELIDATGLPDGDVVIAAGERGVSSGSVLEGIDASGAVDTGFGAGGAVSSSQGTIASIHAVPGGFAIAGTFDGSSLRSPSRDLFVSRFGESGTLAGTTRVDLGGAETLQTALWDTDGSVILGGRSVGGPFCPSFGICRETPALSRVAAGGVEEAEFGATSRSALGALDASVHLVGEPVRLAGEGGVVSLAPRPGGGVYAAGCSGSKAFVAAVNAGGAPVVGFGSGGVLEQSHPKPARSSVNALAVDASQRILVLGEANPDLEWEAAEIGYLARYRRDGSPDTGYGEEGGLARLPEGIRTPGAIAALRGGAALVLGEDGVARIDSSGSPDAAFGRDGLVMPAHDPSRPLVLTAIATLPRGGFMIAGTLSKFRPHESTAIYRYRADGSPDRSFGRGGRLILFGPGRRRSAARALVAQPDGRVLIAGSMGLHPGRHAGGRVAWLARLLPDGRLDRSFGSGGWATLPAGLARLEAVVPSGGGILAGGQSPRGGKITETLLRLRTDGRPDRSFGRGGAARRSWRNAIGLGVRDHLSILVSTRRIVLVSGGAPRPVSAYTLAGRPIPSYGRAHGVLPGPSRRGRPRYGPVAVLQGRRPVLGWTAAVRRGHAGDLSVGWLQRLRVQ